ITLRELTPTGLRMYRRRWRTRPSRSPRKKASRPPDDIVKRAEAERLDAEDPIGWLRDHFVIDDPGLIYLDGNSLGRLPKSTVAAVNEAMRAGWGSRLGRAWHDWIDVGQRVGDHLGKKLLGAAPGQVAVSDSTSVNLYKLATAALDTRPGRRVILSSSDNFPTDRYILEGLAAARG